MSQVTGNQRELDAEKVPAARREEASLFGLYKPDRARLRREIRAALKPAFGEPKKQGDGVWNYCTPFPGLLVETSVDFGGRHPPQFRYRQEFYWVIGAGIRGGRMLFVPGICALLGYEENAWSYVADEDVPATAQLLARLCTEAIEAVPSILERAAEIDGASLH